MMTCSKCGTQLPPGAQFCPKCGAAVAMQNTAHEAAPHVAASAAVPPAVPPAQHAPRISARATPPPPAAPHHVQPKGTRGWWIVPAVIVGLILGAWLLLAGLPFGRDERKIATRTATETIAESTTPAAAPQPTGTILELPGDAPIATTVTSAPPLADPTVTIGIGQQPPPVRTAPAPAPAPTPVTVPPPPREEPPPMYSSEPPPQKPPAAEEISEGEAVGTLRSYLASRDVYEGVSGDCLQVRSQGYQNVGYTMTVWNACNEGGGSRMLGRWRVDAKTREVFRQRGDGRYLRP